MVVSGGLCTRRFRALDSASSHYETLIGSVPRHWTCGAVPRFRVRIPRSKSLGQDMDIVGIFLSFLKVSWLTAPQMRRSESLSCRYEPKVRSTSCSYLPIHIASVHTQGCVKNPSMTGGMDALFTSIWLLKIFAIACGNTCQKYSLTFRTVERSLDAWRSLVDHFHK